MKSYVREGVLVVLDYSALFMAATYAQLLPQTADSL